MSQWRDGPIAVGERNVPKQIGGEVAFGHPTPRYPTNGSD